MAGLSTGPVHAMLPTRSSAAPLTAPGWHPLALLAVLAAWLASVGNLPLWLSLGRLPEMTAPHLVATLVLLGGALFLMLLATLALLVWPRWRKPVGVLLLVTVAVSSHFMLSYGIVVDPTMLDNVLHTDTREVRDLLSPTLGVALLLGVALPGWWWWRQPVRPVARLLPRQAGLAVLALLAALVLLWLGFQDLASLMRNHKDLRYRVNPYNTVYALARQAHGSVNLARQPLQPMGEDAMRAHGAVPGPLLVLVVGETTRAANFGLGGYARDTTPQLKALMGEGGMTYFGDVRSCGTNTETSVPCLFSHLGREGYMARTQRHENLLDALQRAGMGVMWVENQSGCKGVCDRVPHADASELVPGTVCDGGECQDTALLQALPAALQRLTPEQRARGTVLVLHQMGSHGPAYYKRTPAALKAFTPECTSAALQDCPREQVVNAYDNSVRATDDLLAGVVRWLRSQPGATGLLYVSDHGESLGEKGLYLHGMPYAFAPDEQTRVPMLMWLSPTLRQAMALDEACLRARAGRPASHDNWFPTVLDLAQVHTRWSTPGASLLAGCTGPAWQGRPASPQDASAAPEADVRLAGFVDERRAQALDGVR